MFGDLWYPAKDGDRRALALLGGGKDMARMFVELDEEIEVINVQIALHTPGGVYDVIIPISAVPGMRGSLAWHLRWIGGALGSFGHLGWKATAGGDWEWDSGHGQRLRVSGPDPGTGPG